MRNPMMFLVVGSLCALAACLPWGPLGGEKAPAIMPLVSPQPARTRISAEPEFRLGAFDFGRAAGEGSELGNIIPAMLLTELRNGGRFSIYEGGNIRSDEQYEPLSEKNAKTYLDGYLSGTITLVTAQQACFELRISNAVNYEVLYGRNACIPMGDKRQMDRGAVKRIAEDIERALKKIGYGKVMSSDGKVVFLDKGSQSGVTRGMVACIVASGDSVSDPEIHRAVQSYTQAQSERLLTSDARMVVGEIYVTAVEKEYSVGVLYNGEYVLPGDSVFFK
jgi:hypothetical protein